jgi:hypothetical protein
MNYEWKRLKNRESGFLKTCRTGKKKYVYHNVRSASTSVMSHSYTEVPLEYPVLLELTSYLP